MANIQGEISYLERYCRGTHVRTNGTDVFVVDMLSSISQAGGDKSMKPMAFYETQIGILFLYRCAKCQIANQCIATH